jgi:hypothetical protein
MYAHNNRAGVRTARLGLESLEGRIVLSATVPAPTPVVGQTASAASEMQVQHLTTASVPQATYARFGYHWGIGPAGTVIQGTNTTTGNGKSTGSVDFALVRDGQMTARVGGPAAYLPVGFVMTTSSASAAHPDHYHANFSVTLRLRDASGVMGTVTFKGTINGTLTWGASHLTVTFQTPTTQRVTLGHHVYTVSLPTSINLASPTAPAAMLYAKVQVSARR